MGNVKVTSKNQTGGTTASRVNSPDFKVTNKIITRQRTEGFIVGIVASIVAGVVLELIKNWLF